MHLLQVVSVVVADGHAIVLLPPVTLKPTEVSKAAGSTGDSKI